MNSVATIIERVSSVKPDDVTREFSPAASHMDGSRQGDVMVTYLESIPNGIKLIKCEAVELQVAPGTTQGSRHAWAHSEGIEMHRINGANEYDGPVYKLAQTNTLTHPEHGDQVCQPGWYAIGYQRTGKSEAAARRVRD